MILYSLRLSQHSVLSWSLGREEVATSPIGNSSMIFLKLTFRREVGFYVLQVYIPLTIIVCCSFLSFWLVKEVTARSYLLGESPSLKSQHEMRHSSLRRDDNSLIFVQKTSLF